MLGVFGCLVVLSGCERIREVVVPPDEGAEMKNSNERKELHGKIVHHDSTKDILYIGSDAITIEYLPKLISLKGVTVKVTNFISLKATPQGVPEFYTKLYDNVEIDGSPRIEVRGKVKIFTDKEVAILLYNNQGLPELSVTCEFDENIGSLKKGQEITIKGDLKQLKFDWYRMSKCKILLVH